MTDALSKIKKETGLDLVMDDEAIDGDLWDYEVHGEGNHLKITFPSATKEEEWRCGFWTF
jgi:hypothetical protein